VPPRRPPPPPPGLLAPAVPSKAQIDAVERLVWDNVHSVEALEAPALRAVLPVLKEVRDELRRDLARWLATAPNGAERFTAQRLRVALRQVEGAIQAAARLEPAMASALKMGRNDAGTLAVSSLDTEIARFGSIFGESIRPIQLDTAAVIARGDRLLWKRHMVSAARYGGQVGDDIRHQLAVGVARGETFAELKARLVRHGGPRGLVALRGRLGDPDVVAEHISEGLFARYRWWAERLVRTELMHGYNLQHREGIALLNQNLDAGQEPYVRLWDAAADRRVCPICYGLDGKTAAMDGTFPGGYDHPPAHPNCRCVEVAWHRSWGSIAGERQHADPFTRRAMIAPAQ
jgi:SPP1 gp7 family putative phage head morphogenesis protein